MNRKTRDIEKIQSPPDFVAKLRRLADAIESGSKFELQVANERIYVPKGAEMSVEHERGDGAEELEFQLKWKL
jgi:amphi-Trp domain-containing protein